MMILSVHARSKTLRFPDAKDITKKAVFVAEEIRSFLKKTRKKLKLNADQAADIIGVSARTLRKLENGENVGLTFNSYTRMAELYKITIGIPTEKGKTSEAKTNKTKMEIISSVQNLNKDQLNILTSSHG